MAAGDQDGQGAGACPDGEHGEPMPSSSFTPAIACRQQASRLSGASGSAPDSRSAVAAPSRPRLKAHLKGVWPEKALASRLAPRRISSTTRGVWPASAAAWRGVAWSRRSLAAMSAPASRRAFAVRVWPLSTASLRGVKRSPEVTVSVEAPASTSKRAILACPWMAAM